MLFLNPVESHCILTTLKLQQQSSFPKTISAPFSVFFLLLFLFVFCSWVIIYFQDRRALAPSVPLLCPSSHLWFLLSYLLGQLSLLVFRLGLDPGCSAHAKRWPTFPTYTFPLLCMSYQFTAYANKGGDWGIQFYFKWLDLIHAPAAPRSLFITLNKNRLYNRGSP